MTTETTLPRRGRPPTVTVLGDGKYAMTIRGIAATFKAVRNSFRLASVQGGELDAADVEYGITLLRRTVQ